MEWVLNVFKQANGTHYRSVSGIDVKPVSVAASQVLEKDCVRLCLSLNHNNVVLFGTDVRKAICDS